MGRLRRNTKLTINGKVHTIVEWSRITGIGAKTIRSRIKSGWDLESVLDPINRSPLPTKFPREHNSWEDMMSRCYKTAHKKYFRYGGRDISVCDRWHKFDHFLEDMGEKPLDMSLDRINNDGHYEPSNCRWATPTQQAQNRSNNVNITINGETCCLSEWSRRSGISRDILKRRWLNGCSDEQMLEPPRTTPVENQRS